MPRPATPTVPVHRGTSQPANLRGAPLPAAVQAPIVHPAIPTFGTLAALAPLASGGSTISLELIIVAIVVGIVTVAMAWLLTRRAGSGG